MRPRALWGLVAVGLLTLLGGMAGAQAERADTLILARSADRAEMEGLIADLQAAGGQVRVIFAPHVLIGSLDEGARAALGTDPRVELAATTYVTPSAVPAGWGEAARDGINAWNNAFAAPAPRLPRPPGRPLVGDTRLAPPPPASTRLQAAPSPAPPGAAYWQGSEFMMGRVVVSLIILESSGAIDGNTENWSPERRDQVIAKCTAAVNWWASVYPYSVAPLSFEVVSQTVPTGYEPITHSSSQDGLWVQQAYSALGYTSVDRFTNAYNYNNDLRNNRGADWAYTVFVVDSYNDADGTFTDGYFGYAYIQGPYVMMTYDNDGWGIERMDRVLAHETGHIFGAGDEYCVPGYACCDPDEKYGYLGIVNSSCGSGLTCLMNSNDWVLCSVTRQQVGWRDTDTDGNPDILDVAPTATLTPYSPDPTTNTSLTFTGSSAVAYYPNQPGRPNVTLNRIAGVRYRVDSGSWLDCTATDGAFDGGTEPYRFTATVAAGLRTFQVKAVTTTGVETLPPYPQDTVQVNQVLDHLVVSVLGAAGEPQGADLDHPLPFAIQVLAVDAAGDPLTGLAGSVTLSSGQAAISPSTMALSAGAATGPITAAADAAGDCTISAALGSVTGDLTVPLRLKCDVNADTAVNVLDVMRAVNLALSKTPPTPPRVEFQLWAADPTAEGTVNVLDVLQIVNASLGVVAPAASPLLPAAPRSPITVFLQRTARGWQLVAGRWAGVAGLQVELRLRPGVTLAGVQAEPALAGWQVSFAQGRGWARLLAFQPQARPLPAGRGPLLTLSLAGAQAGRPSLSLGQAVLGSATGRPLPVTTH